MKHVNTGLLTALSVMVLISGGVAQSQEKRTPRGFVLDDPVSYREFPGLLGGLSQLLVLPFQWVVLRIFGFDLSWAQFMRPLPIWLLFSMLVTPALGGIFHFRPRHEVDGRYRRYPPTTRY